MILWLIASRSLNWFHSLTRLDWILFLLQWAQFVCSNAIIAQIKGQSQFKCNHAIRSCYSSSALMFFGVTDLFRVAGFCCCCLFVLLWMHSNLSGKCCVSAVGGLSLGRGCLFLLTLQVVESFRRGAGRLAARKMFCCIFGWCWYRNIQSDPSFAWRCCRLSVYVISWSLRLFAIRVVCNFLLIMSYN